MIRRQKKQGRRDRKKLKKVSTPPKSKPYGVFFCHKENKAIGYVPVRLKVDKKGKTYCKDKAYADSWKTEAKWVPGYEPSEEVKKQMIDHHEAHCPRCNGKASFLVMYDVKITDKPLVDKGKLEELARERELAEFDKDHASDFHEYVKEVFAENVDPQNPEKFKNMQASNSYYAAIRYWIRKREPTKYIEDKYLDRAKKFTEQEMEIHKRLKRREKNR